MIRSRAVVALSSLLLAGSVPATAAVTVSMDAPTLNDLLSALTVQEIAVPITDTRSVTVRMNDLRVLGLTPDDGHGGRGHIRTAVQLEVPELGLRLPVEPQVSLGVVRQAETSLIEVRFDRVLVPLPLTGPIDVARMLPPLLYPADNAWLLAGARGDAQVQSRLSGVEMGRDAIHLHFEVEVLAPGAR